jgi:hypothetical protein
VFEGFRLAGGPKWLVAGAIVGAVVGGTLATSANGYSGPAFWTGVGAGIVLGTAGAVVAAALTRLAVHRHARRHTRHR